MESELQSPARPARHAKRLHSPGANKEEGSAVDEDREHAGGDKEHKDNTGETARAILIPSNIQ